MRHTTQTIAQRERVLLVGVGVKAARSARPPGLDSGEAERASLRELDELARSAGADVTGTLLQMRDALDPATLVGHGKLEEIKMEARMRQAPLVVFDRNLSPVQLRNIEKATDCRVIDRTQLILDIFARHAHSREGQLQVELAQLNYLMPRLTGHGHAMSRLGGKSAGMQGGIGMRGPGEQKLETDRRRIRDRVRKIEHMIDRVRRQRMTRRRARQAVPLGTVALVGYTNAGKSTLFNALTKSDVVASPRMFATLDPTVRALRLPSNRKALLGDTVGFIRELPPGLIAAFRATLEEVQEAAVLLHVTDITHPLHAEQDEEVEKILRELGVADRPRLRVLNKIDLLPPAEAEAIAAKLNHGSVCVSSKTGAGFPELLRRLDALLGVDPTVQISLRLPLADARRIALLHAVGRVLDARADENFMHVRAEVPQSFARHFTADEVTA